MTESEILIIGGGIAGASTAYHLARLGHGVALLDGGEIATEASGVNAGSIGAMGWGDVPDLQAYLTMGSLQILKSLELDLGCRIDLRVSGALQAIHSEDEYAFVGDRVLHLRAQGCRAELLTLREARSIEPELNPVLLGCAYFPLWAQADPKKTTRAFAAAAVGHGARVFVHHLVRAIHARAGRGYEAQTPHGTFRAEVIVLAAGAWCRDVAATLGLSIPVVPVRGQMWSTASLPPRLFHTILAAESALHWYNDPGADTDSPPELTHRGRERLTRHLYGRQTRDGEIIFGGDRQLAGYDKTPDPEGIEVSRAHAAEVVPLLRQCPIRRTWAGLMPFTLDGSPIIGRLPHVANAYVVSGLASSGFGRGPMAGKLLAEFIHTGYPHPVLAEADPARCVTRTSSHG